MGAAIVDGGLAIVDKPAGMTSHDVVARMRRAARTRRVGHAGTLDPMATGVLLVGIERATKLLGYLSGHDKDYRATIRLGQATVTDDAEGDIVAENSAAHVGDDTVVAALREFVGDISQVPSAVSAIKVDGRRSYARVRSGEQVELAARPVHVERLVASAFSRPEPGLLDVDVELTCSSGTYVRAIARDLGTALGVGGHLTALRRTRIGAFPIELATPLAELTEQEDPVSIGLDELAARVLPRRDVTAEQARSVGHGGKLAPAGIPEPYGVFGPDGRVVAVLADRGEQARPLVVLRPVE